MPAIDAQWKAHDRALHWSHVLEWQVTRLREARGQVVASQERVRITQVYEFCDRWPFFKLDAEAHFTLVAARQLLRALKAFDGNDRFPASLPDDKLRLLRDALEHWDEPTGRASRQMEALEVDPHSHQWSSSTAEGVLGDLVTDESLRQWAADVYIEMQAWDPESRRPGI